MSRGEPQPLLSPDEEGALRERFDLAGTPEELTGDFNAEAERECDRLLRALKAVRAEMGANERARDAEVQRADRWLARMNEQPLREESWLLHMLETIAPYVPRYGRKSREFPHGIIGWRTNPVRLKVEDPDAALAWAKARGLEIKREEGVPHKALVEAWKASKEVPAGCKVEEGKEVFYVSPAEVG